MNQDVISRIERYTYWDVFEDDVDRRSNREILNDMDELMLNVEENVAERAEQKNNDVGQTLSTVAGNYFQALVSYATVDIATENGLRILHNKQLESTELADVVPTIGGGETALSPDADIVYYDPEDESSPIFILSCKTSFRERMDQSAMWKLLFQVSEHSCTDSDCPTNDYSFSGEFEREIYMGFATVDFYDSVDSKDIVEMFDFGYASTVDNNSGGTTYPMQKLIDHIEDGWNSFQ